VAGFGNQARKNYGLFLVLVIIESIHFDIVLSFCVKLWSKIEIVLKFNTNPYSVGLYESVTLLC
jgi:hypothetical protein